MVLAFALLMVGPDERMAQLLLLSSTLTLLTGNGSASTASGMVKLLSSLYVQSMQHMYVKTHIIYQWNLLWFAFTLFFFFFLKDLIIRLTDFLLIASRYLVPFFFFFIGNVTQFCNLVFASSSTFQLINGLSGCCIFGNHFYTTDIGTTLGVRLFPIFHELFKRSKVPMSNKCITW